MSNGNTNYYDKEVWSNIPIDYDEAMSTGEAQARGLQIIGLDDYLKSKDKNPKVQKFSIVMQGQLYFFPVDPKYTEDFLKAFTEPDGQFYELSGGRKPFLIFEKDKMSTKEMLAKLRESDKGFEFAPEISTTDHLKEEINFAVQNNDAALVDNLYVHLIDNLSGQTNSPIKKAIDHRDYPHLLDQRKPWQKKFDDYVYEQQQLQEEQEIKDAKDAATIKHISGGGAGNATIIEDPTNEKQLDIVFTRTPGY